MRILVLYLFFSMCLSVFAAKPIEISLEKITYQIRSETRDAIVVKADEDIEIANIRSYIGYENEDYPVVQIQGAFSNCIKLTNVHIPETVKEISRASFYWCINLKMIQLPQSLNIIGESAFTRCSNLTSIEFPKNLQQIGKSAFSGCINLEKVLFNGKVDLIDEDAFQVGDAFQLVGNLKNVFVPTLEDWLDIQFNGFLANNSANPLSNANANLYINDEIVEDLVIPNGVVCIANRAFGGCGSLKSVRTPPSIENIGIASFAKCPNLELIELGEGIKEISYYSFYNCPRLNIVKLHSIVPPALTIGYNLAGEQVNAFADSYPEYMTLHIPEGTKEAYENAYGWKDFGTIIDDLPNDSGIDEVAVDDSELFEIFNMNGIGVFTGRGDHQLPSGVYIVRQGCKSKKIIIQ